MKRFFKVGLHLLLIGQAYLVAYEKGGNKLAAAKLKPLADVITELQRILKSLLAAGG